MEAFKGRLQELRPRTCITVFRDQQLPLRGRVNEEFTRHALELVPDGTEFLIVALQKTAIGAASWFCEAAGESHGELVKELRGPNFYGKQVALGPYPPWLDDTNAVISAVVPDEDGIVTAGIY